jgi:hypothetical protein
MSWRFLRYGLLGAKGRMSSEARAPDDVHEILAALEALGVRVSLSDDDRIALRGAQAPTELRRALMQHGTQARAILAQRREMREAASNAIRLRAPDAKPAAQGCADHMGFRDKPCRRCGRSWGAHYPWVKAPLPSLQHLRPKHGKPAPGKHVPVNENPGPGTTAS